MSFGEQLTPCELAILGFLAGRAWADAETISRATAEASRKYDHAAPRKPQTIKVHVFGIREKLGDGAIIHMPDRGYMLGAPGVKVWRAHLAAKAALEAAR